MSPAYIVLWIAVLIGGPPPFQDDWVRVHAVLCKASGRGETPVMMKWERGEDSITVICRQAKKKKGKPTSF